MKLTTPKVRLIKRPAIDWEEVERYLRDIGVSDDAFQRLLAGRGTDDDLNERDGEALTEIAGRLCYRSWEPGLNPNVVKIREDQAAYLTNILQSGHGSVLEHADYTFILQDVSRVFTHELVRHRVGVAISQESMRYVRLTDIPFWIPEWAQRDKAFMHRAEILIDAMEDFQQFMTSHFKLDMCVECGNHLAHPTSHDVDAWPSLAHRPKPMPFAKKKAITSFMRRFAPHGLTTSMVWSANIRTLRFIIEKRTEVGVEEEMLAIIPQIARLMQKEVPLLFRDYTEQPDGSWQTPYRKV